MRLRLQKYDWFRLQKRNDWRLMASYSKMRAQPFLAAGEVSDH